MELLALAIVNVVTAVAMYFFFALRFSRAVQQTIEQSRKNTLLRDLKENVELTVEYINSSLDTMDQKTRAFYQLLRRSEDLARQLEALHAAGEKGAPTRKRSKTTPKRAGSSAKEPKRPTPAAPPQTPADAKPDPGEVVFLARQSSYNVDRVLAGLGEDRLDISAPADSVDSAYLSGARSRAPRTPLSPLENVPGGAGDGTGVLGKIGTIARRILGIDPIPDVLASALDSSPRAAPTAPRPAVRFTIPDLPPDERGASVPRPAVSAETETPARLPRLDRLELGDGPEPGAPASSISRGGPVSPGAAYGPAARAAAGPAPMFSGQPDLPDAAAILAREMENLPEGMPLGEARRADIIRTLLLYGYRPDDISRATGITLPEVELVASLPASGQRPRRQRLNLPPSADARLDQD